MITQYVQLSKHNLVAFFAGMINGGNQNTTDLPIDSFCGKYPPVVDDLYVCAALAE
jgi:hypothetical protein